MNFRAAHMTDGVSALSHWLFNLITLFQSHRLILSNGMGKLSWIIKCWELVGVCCYIFKCTTPIFRSCDSDWIRAGWQMGRSSSPGRVKNFYFSTSSRPSLGSTQPPIRWVPGDLSPGVKRSGREADHSPPASAEINKIWIYTSTPPTPSWHSA
jgi:hypothetical protein